MEKKIKIARPTINNFIQLERSTNLQGVQQQLQIHITELTKEECFEYAEMLKDSFIEHWENLSGGVGE